MTVASRFGGLTEGGFNVNGLPALIVIGASSLFFFFYFFIFETLFSRTLGKMIVGLKVVREGRENCDFVASLLRNMLRFVDFFFGGLVGLIFLLTTRKAQRLGDVAAKTRVVWAPSVSMRLLGAFFWLLSAAVCVVGALRAEDLAAVFFSSKPTAHAPAPSPVKISSGAMSSSSPSSGNLRLQRLRFTDGKEGPVLQKNYGPSDEVYLAFDVVGVPLNTSRQADAWIRFEAVDSQGQPLVEPLKIDVKGQSETAAAVVPANFHLTLPAYLEGGTYRILLTVHDNTSGAELKETVPYMVEGPHAPVDAMLGIENYRFLTTPQGPENLGATYMAGAVIYSRFMVVGFKRGEQNRVAFRLDLSVLSAEEKVFYDKKELVQVDRSFYYPPVLIPVTTQVTLPESTPPGPYKMRYRLTDLIAGTQVLFEKTFYVK